MILINLLPHREAARKRRREAFYGTLAGGSAALPGLNDAVTTQTSFPCNLADPFEGMSIGDGVREKKMRREAPSYLTSCGLAMRRFLQ